MSEPGKKGQQRRDEKRGGVGKKRGQRDEKMEAGTANKPRDEIRQEKNEAVKVVQEGAVGSVRKVGRGSKQGV
jgi:hypothetical protein